MRNRSLQIPQIGKIKIGEPSVGKAPKKLDYIKVMDLMEQPFPEIEAVYGKKPKSIEVMFLFDDIDSNIVSMNAMFRGDEYVDRCISLDRNEENMAIRVWNDSIKKSKVYDSAVNKYGNDEHGNLNSIIKCPGLLCPYFKTGKCKLHTVVNFIIVDPDTHLPILNKIGGVFKFRTASVNTLTNIYNCATMVKSLTDGKLAGIPLTLKIVQFISKAPGTRGFKPYILDLEYKPLMGKKISAYKDLIMYVDSLEQDRIYIPSQSEKAADPDLAASLIEEEQDEEVHDDLSSINTLQEPVIDVVHETTTETDTNSPNVKSTTIVRTEEGSMLVPSKIEKSMENTVNEEPKKKRKRRTKKEMEEARKLEESKKVETSKDSVNTVGVTSQPEEVSSIEQSIEDFDVQSFDPTGDEIPF